MLIDTVTLYRFSLPLIEPYKLAMGVVGAFDTVLAVIEDGGGTGFGEATILTGYTEETIDGCWRVARRCRGRPTRWRGCCGSRLRWARPFAPAG